MVGSKIGNGECFKPYSGFIEITGHLPRTELISLYSEADLLVHPSLLEGFGKVILEAMAMGLPVITTTATAGEYIIEDGVDGFLVPPADAGAISEKIRMLYESKELRETIGERAAEKAKQFNWERYGKGIVESVMKAWQDTSIETGPR